MSPRSGLVEPEKMVECTLVEVVGFDGRDGESDEILLGLLRGRWNPDIPLQVFAPTDADPEVVARLLRSAADHIEEFGLPIDLAWHPF